MHGAAHTATEVILGLSPLVVALAIFVLTYAVIVTERINRAIIANRKASGPAWVVGDVNWDLERVHGLSVYLPLGEDLILPITITETSAAPGPAAVRHTPTMPSARWPRGRPHPRRGPTPAGGPRDSRDLALEPLHRHTLANQFVEVGRLRHQIGGVANRPRLEPGQRGEIDKTPLTIQFFVGGIAHGHVRPAGERVELADVA